MASNHPVDPKQINLSNWRDYPFNRWAFQHVSELVPSAIVDYEPNQLQTLAYAAKSLDAALLMPFLTETETDSMVVMHHGKIVFEKYENDNQVTSRHILMSATKAVVGLIAGLLSHQGLINLNLPIISYLPELTGTIYAPITLQQLADMRVDIRINTAQQRAYDAATNWEPVSENATVLGLHSFFTSLESAEIQEDQFFSYVSSNTDLLGWAIERAAGRSFPVLLSELLWKPMGAERQAYLTLDKAGSPRCSGGLCATARDFARLGQLILNDGTLDGKIILPRVLINDIANNGDMNAWARGQWGKAFAPLSQKMCYRKGWYVIKEPTETIFAMGNYGQYLFIDRAHQMVIAKFSSWKEATDYKALALTHQLVATIRNALLSS